MADQKCFFSKHESCRLDFSTGNFIDTSHFDRSQAFWKIPCDKLMINHLMCIDLTPKELCVQIWRFPSITAKTSQRQAA